MASGPGSWLHAWPHPPLSPFLPDGTQTPEKTASKNPETPEAERQDSDSGDHAAAFRCGTSILLQSLPKNYLGSQTRLCFQIRQVPPRPFPCTEGGGARVPLTRRWVHPRGPWTPTEPGRRCKPPDHEGETGVSLLLLTSFFLPKTKGNWTGMLVLGPEGDRSLCRCEFFFRQVDQ